MKTIQMQVIADIPISCYNCFKCAETEYEGVYQCKASNAIDLINDTDMETSLQKMLLCDGDNWEIDEKFTKQMIEEDGIYFVKSIVLDKG